MFSRSFFMPKFRCKEMREVFKSEILEKFFSDREMQKIPVGTQSTAISVVERILEEMLEVNPYASLSELFSADE